MRRIGQQKAEVAPAIAPGTQMRRTAAAILVQRGGDLGHAEAVHRGLDHHLGGELHAGGLQAAATDGLGIEAPQPAMEVTDADAEEQAPDPAQDRVAQIAMERRHGPGSDPALETVAHDQIHALAQFVHKDLQKS